MSSMPSPILDLVNSDAPKPRRQKTTPKGKDKSGKPYEPVDIPVPKRAQIERLLKKAAHPNK